MRLFVCVSNDLYDNVIDDRMNNAEQCVCQMLH